MDRMIEHRAVVQAVADGRITVGVNTDGCSACGHGSACGLAKLSCPESSSVRLVFEAPPGVGIGDTVTVLLPKRRLAAYAVLGYLLPAIALLAGAVIGSRLDGSDGGTALGAIVGFLGALVFARVAAFVLPCMIPPPRIAPHGAFRSPCQRFDPGAHP